MRTRAQAILVLIASMCLGAFFLQALNIWLLASSAQYVCNGVGAWSWQALSHTTAWILGIGCLLSIVGWLCTQYHIELWTGLFFSVASLGAGGISNIFERLMQNCVIDIWPIMLPGMTVYVNAADICITAGVLGVVYSVIYKKG